MENIELDLIKCFLCPHECLLKEGQIGLCGVRKAYGDGVKLEGYSRISTMVIEPIEKKPFYHFHPGSKVLSVGGSGCNLCCNFCQNSNISQKKSVDGCKYFSPSAIANLAVSKGCSSVCMTYTEPIIYYEFLMDLADKCKKQNLNFAINTNAYAKEQPWTDILRVVDALNIDWKGKDSIYYDKCGANKFKKITVKERIEQSFDNGNHIELSIPVYRDSNVDDFEDILSFKIKNVNEKSRVPVHVLKILPTDENLNEASDDDSVFEVAELLQSGFHFVYVHNIFNEKAREFRQTVCPDCGRIIATREALKANIKLSYKCCTCKEIFRYESNREKRVFKKKEK